MNHLIQPIQAIFLLGGWKIVVILGVLFCLLAVVGAVAALIFWAVSGTRKKPQSVPLASVPPVPPAPAASAMPTQTFVMSRLCPQCGGALTPDAPEGLCPACLLQRGFQTEMGPGPGASGEPAPAGAFEPPAVEDLAKLFPQLEILECLGRGGMGAVYKARQPRLDRFVALKILAPEKQNDPQFAERFEREARVLARLSHPNIVSVFDFGEVQGRFFLIMEYVDGTTLRQVMQAGKMSSAAALELVPKICEALQYAHSQGIVHRDIKPENILMDKQGHLKIADFGIAKIAGVEAKGLSLTGARDVMGTPHYMAPEQVETPQAVDHRADIYSLGVVFYEMLTGELPLGKFQPPSQKVQVDVRLDEVVLHALEKEPARRYQQASQIKTDVESVAGGRAPQAAEAAAAWSDPGRNGSDKAILPAFLLALFFGVFGAHRFYVRKFVTASLQLLLLAASIFFIVICSISNNERITVLCGILLAATICACLFWACIDCLLLVCKAFRDGQGRRMTSWLHQDNAASGATAPSGTRPANAPAVTASVAREPSAMIIAPGVALMIAGAWKLFYALIGGLVLAGLAGGLGAFVPAGIVVGSGGILAIAGIVLFKVVPSCVMLFGGWQMVQRRSYGWSVAAGVMGIPACSIFGFIAGVWALIVLSRPDVTAVFRASATGGISGQVPSRPVGRRIATVLAAVILIPLALLVVAGATAAIVLPHYLKTHASTSPLTLEALRQARVREESGEFRKNFTQSFPLSADGRFSIENINGRTEIAGWTNDFVTIAVAIHGKSRDRVNELNVSIDSDPSHTAVRTETPTAWNHFQWSWDWFKSVFADQASVDYVVHVPQSVQLQDVTSVNGQIEIQGVAGDIDASTVNGETVIKNARQSLKLTTVNGSIKAQMDALSEGQSVAMNAVNGEMELALPENADASFSVSTVNGEITSEFPGLQPKKEFPVGNKLDGALNHGRAQVKADAVNGTIRFLKRAVPPETPTTPAAPTPQIM